jgi:NTP pyrophosphatase (non-canonical NTP hydrolase)
MTLDDYESAASRTTNLKLTDVERLMDAAAGLAEESGEILSLVRKHTYQAKSLDKSRLETELGDALWCLAITARTAGLSLEQIASANVAKLRERFPEGYKDR